MSKRNKQNVNWIVIDGSIFTEDLIEILTDSGKRKVRESIAFNIGAETAEHIVRLHNGALADRRPCDPITMRV